MSKLEKEAEKFMASKQAKFEDGLENAVDDLRQYMNDKLWDSHELERAFDKLIEVELWAKRSASKHGIIY
jgi:hypothetical protein